MEIAVTNKGVLKNWAGVPEILNSPDSVYEVVRIVDQTPLFLEDHFRRLLNSLEIRGVSTDMDYFGFRKKMLELIRLNGRSEGNVKFVISEFSGEQYWIFSFIPHSYPTRSDYVNGVPVGLISGERENPNAKIMQAYLRGKTDEMIKKQLFYEVLLFDRDGLITEGSRSNVFFVKDDIFYTAPAGQVLVGITRTKVVEGIRELNYKLIEQAIPVSAASGFDAVFLTGTSPKVLPVSRIGNQIFRTDWEPVRKLMMHYDRMIEEYIAWAK